MSENINVLFLPPFFFVQPFDGDPHRTLIVYILKIVSLTIDVYLLYIYGLTKVNIWIFFLF